MLSIYIDDGWENVNLKNEKKHILIHLRGDSRNLLMKF